MRETSVIRYLSGPRLRHGLVAAVAELLAQEDLLNRINVFPVPDGDTGTNLALTARSMLPVLTSSGRRRIGHSFSEIADAALDGARGNSGAILSQFLHGLSDATVGLSRLTPQQLSEAVRQAVNYARSAIERPRQGTMLTVFEAFRDQLDNAIAKNPAIDFAELVHQCVPGLESALKATKGQLDVLAKANVVDAGAAGVVSMINGIAGQIRGEHARPIPDLDIASTPMLDHDASDEGSYRYCTECFVTADELDNRRLRERLTDHGDCLVIAGSRKKIKVHIHTNQPDLIFDIAREFGELSGSKADDMDQQVRSTAHEHNRVAIITDSAGDLSEDESERLNIHMVPLRVHLDDRSFLDKVSLSCAELFDRLANKPQVAKTSQPPPGDFRRLFEYLCSHFDSVVSIQVSGQVSGTLQAAKSAADRTEPSGKVTVVDSKNVSLGQGLITQLAAEWANEGKSKEEILNKLETAMAETKTFAIVDDLGYAVEGGRIPKSSKIVADLLRITPVVRTLADGQVKADRFLIGHRKKLGKFAKYIAKQCDANRTYRIAVGHGNEEGVAEKLLELLLQSLPKVEKHFVAEVGAAIGVHAGPGLLVVAVQPV